MWEESETGGGAKRLTRETDFHQENRYAKCGDVCDSEMDQRTCTDCRLCFMLLLKKKVNKKRHIGCKIANGEFLFFSFFIVISVLVFFLSCNGRARRATPREVFALLLSVNHGDCLSTGVFFCFCVFHLRLFRRLSRKGFFQVIFYIHIHLRFRNSKFKDQNNSRRTLPFITTCLLRLH